MRDSFESRNELEENQLAAQEGTIPWALTWNQR